MAKVAREMMGRAGEIRGHRIGKPWLYTLSEARCVLGIDIEEERPRLGQTLSEAVTPFESSYPREELLKDFETRPLPEFIQECVNRLPPPREAVSVVQRLFRALGA